MVNPALLLLGDKEVRQDLMNLSVNLLNSAPAAALAVTLAALTQWNLEHLAITKDADGKFSIRRISTKETSDISNPNLTPISPPIFSATYRAADAALDTTETLANIAQRFMTNPLGTIGSILTGGG